MYGVKIRMDMMGFDTIHKWLALPSPGAHSARGSEARVRRVSQSSHIPMESIGDASPKMNPTLN